MADITITRTFNAPVQRVWEAWIEPEEIKKWWGPKGWTAPVVLNDLRVGGKFLGCMRGSIEPGAPEQDHWSGGEYQEVVPMERIVTTDYFTDAEGNRISPNEAGMPGDWPEELRVTVTFEEVDGKTNFTLLHEGHPEEMAPLAEQGWNESLDKLEAIL